ncbi:MAG: ABC transporter permease, partial [Burkholderiales bacterium]
AVLVGPLVYRVPIDEIDFKAKLKSPTMAHPLGTDDLGQDVLARMLYGGRISLAVGLAAMLIAVVVGVIIGAIAGMSRGSVDAALMWVTDLFLSLPELPLLLLIIYLFRDSLKAVFGVEGGIFIMIVIVIGGLRWMPAARLVRGQFLSLREKEFVEAAKASGAGDARIIIRHMLPNAVGPIIVSATLIVAAAILTEAALSFLGFGIQPPTPALGKLIADGQSEMLTAWWLVTFPGLTIVAIVLCVNFIGDGLRDALDPTQRRIRA